MRYFLIILCSVITFCANSQVTITNDMARWYLIQADKVVLLERQDSISSEVIKNLGKRLINKDKVIVTYQNDSVLHIMIRNNYDSMLLLKDQDLKTQTKLLTKRTFQRDLSIGIGAGIIGGTAVGQPLIGGAIGGVAVLVRQIFKKK